MAGRSGPICQCGRCPRFMELRRAFKARCRARDLRCWLCGQAIDYDLPIEHPEVFNLDHFKPKAHFPELTEVPSNFRPSHAACNKNRGVNEPVSLGSTTRTW